MKIYFDTNVFDHISKGIGVSRADIDILHSAVSKRRINIVLSYLNLEEVLAQLEENGDQAQAQLRLILRLTDMRHFVKPAGQLLAEDIRSYAENKPLTERFILAGGALRARIRSLAYAKQNSNQLLPLIKETEQDKEKFRNDMQEAGNIVSPAAKLFLKSTKGKRPGWQDYWNMLAASFAVGFANAASVKQEGGRHNNNAAENRDTNGKSQFCPGDERGDIPKGFGQCEAGHEMGGAYMLPRNHYRAY